jgi:hypothetical protein
LRRARATPLRRLSARQGCFENAPRTGGRCSAAATLAGSRYAHRPPRAAAAGAAPPPRRSPIAAAALDAALAAAFCSPRARVRLACGGGRNDAGNAGMPGFQCRYTAPAGMPLHRAAGNGGRRRDAAGAGLYFWCRTELEMLCRCLDKLPLWIYRRSSGTASAACAGLTGCENLARIFDANHSALQRAIKNSSRMIRPCYQRLQMSSMSGLVTVTATCVLFKRRLQHRSLFEA